MLKQGYKLDENNKVVALENLYPAVRYFEKTFREQALDVMSIYSFKMKDYIEGDYISNYTSPDSNDIKKFKICWIGEVKFKPKQEGNLLEHMYNVKNDTHYYYIIFRKRWYNKWANNYYESLPRYHDKDGITVKIDIFLDAVDNNRNAKSTLVLITGDCKIYYIPMLEAAKFGDKIGIVTDKWNQQIIGLPKEMFSETDPNEYI